MDTPAWWSSGIRMIMTTYKYTAAVSDLFVKKTAHYTNLFQAGLPFEHFDDVNELNRYIGDVAHANREG